MLGVFALELLLDREVMLSPEPGQVLVIWTGRMFGASICTAIETRPIPIFGIVLTSYRSWILTAT